ncbi:MAG: DUF3106 domain-containing protein [Silanimonas sp.]
MSASTSSALAAFLRGIEPRARVLARAQAGPALDDDGLLAAVREEFSQRAVRLPLAEWPLRYWGLLLARDELGRPTGQTPAHPLYALTHTRRLALLLRLVAGMEPPGAARVMGLSETAYRALWADAEDKLAEQGVGSAVLMRWHEAFQREARGETAPAPVAGAPRTPARQMPPGIARAPGWRPSPLQWGLGVVMIALLGVLVATFIWPPAGESPTPPTATAPAPAAAPAALSPGSAAPVRDIEADLVVDPDFALLDAAPTSPWRDGVAFLSWYTAQRGVRLPAPAADAPAPTLAWSTLAPSLQGLLAPVQGAWPALDAESQAALVANAEAWTRYDLARRQALREAYAAWLERPALERSALRSAYAEWTALDAGERAALTASAEALAALPAEQQQAQRAAFAALDADAQHDWALGPRLGAQLPGLRPLLAYVPAGEQAALIAALEALSEPTRDALAARVATMNTAQRAALRGRVLAAPVESRAGLLAEAATAP